MADPVVHITNGIPDLGTGNITTLGMTLVDGANAVLGATTDSAIVAGAAGTINAHLRSISRDIAGGIVLQPSASTIGNVGQAGAPWSQNVSQFGGSAVVTGTGIGGVGIPRVTVSSDSSLAATQSGSWDIRNITGSVPLPTGASTSAKQPALGTAGVPSADVITVQGVSGMTALKVDGTGGSFPVTGTVAATQSGAWNITNISGTVSLPTGAATSAKQPALGTAGSASTDVLTVQGASGMTALKTNLFGNANATLDCSSAQNVTPPTGMLLVGAEFNTAPTTITSGNASPLQLDSAGNLLVNVKAGGASGGTSSGFGSSFPASGTAVGAKDSTGANMAALNLDASGNLKVNVAAGGASGGTSSSFGAAIPGTGTAAGFSDGTNMQLARVFDGDTGAGTQYDLGVLLKTPASGGAVDIGVSGQPLRIDPTGTTTQPVSGTVTVTQGTAANLNATVSGTVTANQGGTWNITNISGTVSLPTGAATSANQPTNASLGSTTSGQTGTLSLGAVTTAAPTYTNLQTNALSLTTAGALRVDGSGSTQPVSGTVNAAQSGTWNITNISGTVSLPTGAATAVNQCTAATVGSATAGQSGHLAMGAVTTSAPSYTTGQTDPLSLTTTGLLRVDGSGVTQPVSGTITANQGGTWTVQPGNTANTTAWLVTGTGGTFPATQSGTWNITNISGTISLPTGAATSANQPSNASQGSTTSGQTGTLGMGAVTTGSPTYVTAQTAPLSLDTTGALRVNVTAGSGGGGTSSSFGSAFPATGTAIGVMNSAGTAMTNLKVNASGGLVVDGSAVTQPVSGTFWQTTQPVSIAASVTVQQATAANLNATVTGTVAATQSGNWTARIVGNGGSTLDTVASNNAAMSANMLIIGGQFNTSPGSITTGSAGVLQLNSTGSLRVDGSLVTQPVSGTFWQATQPVSIAATVAMNETQLNSVALGSPSNYGTSPGAVSVQGVNAFVTNTVTTSVSGSVAVTGTFWQATQPISAASLPLPSGASTSALQPTNAGQNSTTSGQTGTLAMTATSGSAPSYTNATTNPLSTDNSGNLRTVSQPVGGSYTGTGTWNNATALNSTQGIITTLQPAYNSIVGQITTTTTITGGAITFEESFDSAATWKTIPWERIIDPSTGALLNNPFTLTANLTQPFCVLTSGVSQVRVRLSTVIAGTGTASFQYTLNSINNIQGTSAVGPSQNYTAVSTLPATTTVGQTVGALSDQTGRMVVIGALRTQKQRQKTNITTTTETAISAAPGAGKWLDCYGIICTNSSATATIVDFRDSTGGNIQATLAIPAGDTRGFTMPIDAAIMATGTNTNWTAQPRTAVSSVEVTFLGVITQ